MAFVDLSQLNQEQRWAIAYGRQQANSTKQWEIDTAIANNAAITAENSKLLPEHHKALVPVPELFTDESWFESEVWNLVNQKLAIFNSQVEQNFKAAITNKTLEERMTIMQQLNVEPVLKPE